MTGSAPGSAARYAANARKTGYITVQVAVGAAGGRAGCRVIGYPPLGRFSDRVERLSVASVPVPTASSWIEALEAAREALDHLLDRARLYGLPKPGERWDE